MSLIVSKDVVRRYVNNECNEAEKLAVRKWLADPAHEAILRELMLEQWNDLSQGKVAEVPLDHVLERLHDYIDSAEKKETQVVALNTEKKRTHFWVRIAAAIVFLIGVSGVMYQQNHRSSIPAIASWKEPLPDTVQYNDKITSMMLPDGTMVWLNAKSKLKYSPDFSGQLREVYLEGEAFFDVTEDKERPFIVYTQDIQVRVLGTAFTVKAYTDDRNSEATLVRGKVVIENKTRLIKDHLEMNPNERVVFSRDTKSLTLTKVKADDYVLWKSGTLRFENESLDNVIRALERWYSVTITVPATQDSGCRLTARIESETLEEMLELLKSSTGIEYTINGNTVSIKGSLCM